MTRKRRSRVRKPLDPLPPPPRASKRGDWRNVAACAVPATKKLRAMLSGAALCAAKAPPAARATRVRAAVPISADERQLCSEMWGVYLAESNAALDFLPTSAAGSTSPTPPGAALTAEDTALLRRWRFSQHDEAQLPCTSAELATKPASDAAAPPCWEVAAAHVGEVMLRISLLGEEGRAGGVSVQLMRLGVCWSLDVPFASLARATLLPQVYNFAASSAGVPPVQTRTLRFDLSAPPSFRVEAEYGGVRTMEPCGDFTTLDAASAGTRVERRRRGERLQRVEVRVATAYASNKQFSRIVAALDRRAAGNGE